MLSFFFAHFHMYMIRVNSFKFIKFQVYFICSTSHKNTENTYYYIEDYTIKEKDI